MGNSMMKLAALDFGIQLLAFFPSAYFRTEKFYDFTGSGTFVVLARLALQMSQKTLHHRIQSNLVTAWAVRLGSFLVYRVFRDGEDRRFRKMRENPLMFFKYWMLQGAWVFVSLLPTLINNQNERTSDELTTRDYLGWGMWTTGFLIETIADYQKFKFRTDPDNAGKFISSGLWSISRHPNYFGEILLWSGLFVSASSSFKGLQWASVLSPAFIYFLLTRVSGVPALERSGLERYGHLPEYQDYINAVPELIPFFGKT